MKKKNRWNFVFWFLAAQLVLALSACKTGNSVDGDDLWRYRFINKTGYEISVKTSSEWRTQEKNGDKTTYSDPHASPIDLSPNTNREVWINSEAVSFSWTSSPESNKRLIYTAVDGSTVTFNAW